MYLCLSWIAAETKVMENLFEFVVGVRENCVLWARNMSKEKGIWVQSLLDAYASCTDYQQC